MTSAALRRTDTVDRTFCVELAGLSLDLDPAGVAIEPLSRTLIVADLHLETGAAYARRGQLLPPYDSRDTLRRLAAVVERHQPARLVLLGDSFHAANGTLRPGTVEFALLERIARGRDLVWIAGNHDPAPPDFVLGESAAAIRLGDVTLRHQPAGDGAREIVGHFHPAARLATRAGPRRCKCFMLSAERLMLPAFGSLTGGLDVFDPAIRAWFAPAETSLFLLTESRLLRLPMSLLARG